jgi:hypothetical protein
LLKVRGAFVSWARRFPRPTRLILEGLAHAGGAEVLGDVAVVEPLDGEIFRNPQTASSHALEDAACEDVVMREDRRSPFRQVEELIGCSPARLE